MTPKSRLAGDLTTEEGLTGPVTRQAQHPAAIPVAAEPARVCPRNASAGLPSPATDPRSRAGEGTKTSPLDRERAAQGIPGPATGRADPAAGNRLPASPVRARAKTPAGASDTDSPPAGTTGRTYTIALPAGLEMLSLNDRLHWRERHRRYQCIKFAAYVTARDAKIPPLGRARIVVEYQPPDRRHRDADNPMAAAKAAVDGVVLAGCLEDDECPRYVTGIWATIGPVYPKGRLVLHLAEVAS